MDRRTASTRLALAAASMGLLATRAWADDDHDHDHGNGDGEASRLSVTVAFGAGLNTAQPGNAANHHVLPKLIRVRRGGVVHFAVAGFHQVMVYFPGVTPGTIALPPASSLFINDNNNLYYRGIAPAGGPPPATPATANPANGVNRIESVSFAEPGDYLVICNVRPHFVDGMFATIRVR